MTDNIPRQPAGSPQGGQFASTGHAEAEVGLGSTGAEVDYDQAMKDVFRSNNAWIARLAHEQYPDATTVNMPEEFDDDGGYFAAVYADGDTDKPILHNGEQVTPFLTNGPDFTTGNEEHMDWDEEQAVVNINDALANADPSDEAWQAAQDRFHAWDEADTQRAQTHDATQLRSVRDTYPDATAVQMTVEFDDGAEGDVAFAPYALDKDGEVLGELPEDFDLYSNRIADLRRFHDDITEDSDTIIIPIKDQAR